MRTKLQKIEGRYSCTNFIEGPLTDEDVRWLIDRVKELEERYEKPCECNQQTCPECNS